MLYEELCLSLDLPLDAVSLDETIIDYSDSILKHPLMTHAQKKQHLTQLVNSAKSKYLEQRKQHNNSFGYGEHEATVYKKAINMLAQLQKVDPETHDRDAAMHGKVKILPKMKTGKAPVDYDYVDFFDSTPTPRTANDIWSNR